MANPRKIATQNRQVIAHKIYYVKLHVCNLT